MDRSARNKRKPQRSASVVVSVLAWLLLMGSAAQAGGAAAATIEQPAENAIVNLNFTGPFVVRWDQLSGDPYTWYDLDIYQGSMWVDSCGWYESELVAGTTKSCYVAPLEEGSYTARVGPRTGSYYNEILDMVPFRVVAPPADIRIIEPVDGSTFTAQFGGPIRVQWDSIGDPSDDFEVRIRESGYTEDSCAYSGQDLSPGATTTCYINPVGVGSYQLEVSDGVNVLHRVAIQVLAAPIPPVPPPPPPGSTSLDLQLTHHQKKKGRFVIYTGNHEPRFTYVLSPPHPGATLNSVWQEQTQGGKWRTIERASFPILQDGTLPLQIDLGAVVPWIPYRVKATFAGDGDHLPSSSRWGYFRYTVRNAHLW